MNKESNLFLSSVMEDALYQSGKVIRSFFKKPLKIFYKGPVDPVTQADKDSEKKILSVIKKQFPHHGFLTEESKPTLSSSPFRWIIDPLDGTINFAHGLPNACVSIGLEKNGKIILGGVYDPFRDELFSAIRGKGAFLNGRRISVSPVRQIEKSLLATGFPYDRNKKADFYLKYVARFLKKCHGIRRLGAAALDMCYVASGRFDAYWEFNIKPWDVAAGWIIVEEAGGRVSDFQGKPYGLEDTSRTTCSNGKIHNQMLKLLQKR